MDNDAKSQLLAQLRAAAKQHLDNLNDERERAIAKMQALGARDDAQTKNTLLQYLTQTDNELLPPLAASRLSEIGDKDVMEKLIVLIDEVESDVATLIVQILAEIGHEEASLSLISILEQSTDFELRRRAAFALGKTGGDAAFETLMTALDNESDIKTRQQIIAALGWLGNEACIPDLVQIMQTDPDKETQTFAAEALGQINSEKCFVPLVDTLQSHHFKPIVRYYAAHALGLLGDKRAIEPLKAIAEDPSEHSWVAQMASEALEQFVS